MALWRGPPDNISVGRKDSTTCNDLKGGNWSTHILMSFSSLPSPAGGCCPLPEHHGSQGPPDSAVVAHIAQPPGHITG